MTNQAKPKQGEQQQRTIQLAFREVNQEERRVTVSFSSEQPVTRWFGSEILQHDEGNVNLDRLNSIGVSLFNHNRDKVLGRIENARLAADEKRTYADIVFDPDPDADLIFQKVQSGTLKGISVGYCVDCWEEVAPSKLSSNGRFMGPCDVATRWTPMEISIVSVPADDSVGVGRSAGEAGGVAVGLLLAERQRASEINALCWASGVDPTEYIDSGTSVEAVRAITKTERSSKVMVTVIRDDMDKFRAALTDALLFRGGIHVQDPAEGYRELAGMHLRDMAVECVLRKGIANPRGMDDDALLREAFSPDSQFSNILSDAANKSMAIAYQAAETTYQAWTARGSNPNFKPAKVYQISDAGDLLPITQSGEFKFDEMSDQGITKSIATFGRAWAFSRQAVINDDLESLTKIPAAYARAAARGINKLVYKLLGENAAIYDNTALFHDDHANLASVGGIINTTNVGAGRAAMRKQKGLRGIETLNIASKYMLLPTYLDTQAQRFLMSPADPDSLNSGVPNVFKDKLIPVVDAELDDYGLTAWYLAANPSDIDTIEVTYLNGKNLPTIESEASFDYLGVKWRIYIDYGVTVLDFRGLYKNPGIL